ncbi:MAG: PilZ domain-containing protein [Gammaproteobacteria bacterium]|nr:PilZ domain-containing protein [Gammaproteobacteria bacterium]
MLHEQRDLERKPVELVVTLSSGNQKRDCHIRDMNLNGAFIECGCQGLNVDDDVELSIGSAGNGSEHKVPAKVARIGDNGAALRFRKFDISTFGSILKLLYVK